MSIAFNAFGGPTFVNGTTSISFQAINQPNDFVWQLIGSNLVYTAPGIITGVINTIALVDGAGTIVQTISVDPALRAAGMAAQLTQFLTQARAAIDATFGDWGLMPADLQFVNGGSATQFLLVLLDPGGNPAGYLEVNGSGFVPGNGQAGVVTSIRELDINFDQVADHTAVFPGFSLNALSYGLLLSSVAAGADSGAVGAVLTQGANTVMGFSDAALLDGGAGNDALVGGTGGFFVVSYDSLTSGVGVRVSLALTTAQVTGGGGTDTLTRIIDLEGSRFNDTLTGSTAANVLLGNEGDDDLFGGLGNDTLRGDAGDDALDGGAGADSLFGGGGVDSASYASSATAVAINLLTEVLTGADAVGDVYEGITGLVGSRFADTLTGDAGNNRIEGGVGADSLNGGDGFDTVSYARSAAGVRIDLTLQAGATGQAAGGDGAGDRLSGFEDILGSAFNDTLTGDAGDNILFGGRGNDLLAGGTGADTLDGGEGIDTATYAASGVEVMVDLIGPINGGDAEGDVLIGIENLIGSAFGDELYGFGIANRIDGGAGDDLILGDSGNDTLIGGTNGEDGDTVTYFFDTAGVTVSLALTTAQNTGGSGIDVISGFENLEGSNFSDVLTGTTTRNVFIGFAGNDRIFAGAGDDDLNGDDGDDTLEGGAGADFIFGGDVDEINGDTVSYAGSAAAVRVDLQIQDNGEAQVSMGDASGDTLFDIENVIGSRFADALTGDDGDNIIQGGAGADILTAGQHGAHGDTVSYASSTTAVRVDLRAELQAASGAGDASGDRLFEFENITGSAFNDTLTGNAENNWLTGGAGNDVLVGGGGTDTLDGGAGAGDVADFSAATGALTIDLSIPAVTGGGLDGTMLIDIEGAVGGAGNDILIASASGGTLTGGSGDDSVEASNFNDTLDGGANSAFGRDTLSYDRALAGVNVNLSLTTAQITGGSGTDVIRGFEKLEGSSFNDTLTGDAGNNEIQGRSGNDLMSGLAGADSLIGGEGNDTLIGGAGADVLDGSADIDTASYAASAAGVSVSLLSGVGLLGDAAGDVLLGIENLIGTRLADTLIGDSGENVIVGGAGADSLDGGVGTDTLSYAASTVAVNASLIAGVVGIGGDAAGDRISGFENLIGTALNDTLVGNVSNNQLFGGRGNDVLGGTDGFDTLDGGDGIDVADFSRNTAGVTILLTNQTAFGVGVDTTLISIERAFGGTGRDSLLGNDAANVLNGGDNNDTIQGGLGNDTLNGGAGFDLLEFDGLAGVTASLSITTAQNFGAAYGTDLITGFEGIIGTNFIDNLTGSTGDNFLNGKNGNDTLTGLAGNDRLYGGGDDDLLIGGAGADLLDGSTGIDTASYRGGTVGVTVSLAMGVQVSAGDASGDEILDIENLIGSSGADMLTGNGVDNVFDGGLGADRLFGGANTAAGDTVTYAASTVAVNASLIAGMAGIGGDAAGDLLVGFENITGSAFNDTLVGDAGANVLTGGLGNDLLRGGGGGDRLDGGAGTGDTASYDGFGAGIGVNLVSGSTSNTGGDTLLGIENLIGGTGNDTLVGNAMANRMDGSAGNDEIDGGGGVDVLLGGLGQDRLVFGAGAPALRINLSLTTAQVLGTYGSVTLNGFEDVRGTGLDDNLTGSLVVNVLEGGAGRDTLSGLAGDDMLFGGDNDDLLFGGAGADVLNGGRGVDTVSYVASTAGVSVFLFNGTATGSDAQGDTLDDIENLIGSRFADLMFGDIGDNVLEGGAGADRLSGSDNLIGGFEGGDTVSYALSAAAVNVDLRRQGAQPGSVETIAQSGGDAAGDLLAAFEKIIGSAFNDTLTGDDSVNTLFGGRGNDVLRAIGDGDRLYGGDGSDTLTFAGETFGTDVRLGNAIANFGSDTAGLFEIENVTGGLGNDSIFGDQFANVLNGGDGDDRIEGGFGNDTLIGGVGVDTIIYDGAQGVTVSLSITTAQNLGIYGIDVISGFEVLQTTNQNDSVTGSIGGDVFFARGGNDVILGLGGNDTIDAGEGNDTLIGGAGADSLSGNGGLDTASYATSTVGVSVVFDGVRYIGIFGDAAGDSFLSIENLTGSRFNDTLTGDAGANVIEGGAGTDSLTGGGGIDTVSYAGSAVAVRASLVAGVLGVGGDAAGDRLFGFQNILGSRFNDTLIGDAGANLLTGGLGINVLEGGAGADTLDGSGSVNDTASYAGSVANLTVNLGLATQAGAEAEGDELIGIENLIGGAGGDFLTGDAGNNRIDGGAGADVIEGGAGNDTLIGGTSGTDRDTAFYTNAAGGVTVSLAITTAQNTGGAGIDVISGFENLNGSTLADRLTGDALANIITGSDGDDTINGGLGNDVFFGGSGADQFVFNTTLGATTNVDTMVSFQLGMDKIVLENAVFTALGVATGALSDAQFALTTETLGAADRIIYNAATGALFYDRDGSGTAVAVQFANVVGNIVGQGVAGLSASDFLII